MSKEWKSIEHALRYLSIADKMPHRTEGESVLLEEIPPQAERILDIGSGDGRLLDLCLLRCPNAFGVALDYSPPMLEKLRDRYAEGGRVEVVEHDINHPLPLSLGRFDVIVSSFSIHHVGDKRKYELYGEIWQILENGGVFCNLEHVSSPTNNLHEKFFAMLGISLADEDKSNILLDVETQLEYLRRIGFEEVDCYWKWRELALLIGKKACA
jgi:SAM-dependent methyltransferase